MPAKPPRAKKFQRYDLLKDPKLANLPPSPLNHADDVIALALQTFAPMWAPNQPSRVYQSDNYYMCPSLDGAQRIIQLSVTRRMKYVAESFDCDDFAVLLKADFSLCSYLNGDRGGGYAFGIVWFTQPSGHAMNFMVNDDGNVRFTEPQRGVVIEPSDMVRSGITLAVL